mmetsp:Transcript_13126/g.27279  ORF Transcript_13126/g.27279 Transcript_13126/m.27279 type:complete len:226 (+) Transcript_13126:126-803(+)
MARTRGLVVSWVRDWPRRRARAPRTRTAASQLRQDSPSPARASWHRLAAQPLCRCTSLSQPVPWSCHAPDLWRPSPRVAFANSHRQEESQTAIRAEAAAAGRRLGRCTCPKALPDRADCTQWGRRPTLDKSRSARRCSPSGGKIGPGQWRGAPRACPDAPPRGASPWARSSTVLHHERADVHRHRPGHQEAAPRGRMRVASAAGPDPLGPFGQCCHGKRPRGTPA